mmetsp:Transcript_14033/g.43866  ORF Transcript_14033/g.43866 Transcript_14033/m.43866 type:complete len:209 (+) Transcript_14033:1168-1794(+)
MQTATSAQHLNHARAAAAARSFEAALDWSADVARYPVLPSQMSAALDSALGTRISAAPRVLHIAEHTSRWRRFSPAGGALAGACARTGVEPGPPAASPAASYISLTRAKQPALVSWSNCRAVSGVNSSTRTAERFWYRRSRSETGARTTCLVISSRDTSVRRPSWQSRYSQSSPFIPESSSTRIPVFTTDSLVCTSALSMRRIASETK